MPELTQQMFDAKNMMAASDPRHGVNDFLTYHVLADWWISDTSLLPVTTEERSR